MTTRPKLKPNDYAFDLIAVSDLINGSIKYDETDVNIPVAKEIADIDDKIDKEERKVESMIPNNNFAGIIILFLVRCVFACFKYAFNLGYYLASFICRRRVVRLSLGFIFGIFTNALLLLLIYGFYILYLFFYTLYFSGPEVAKDVTNENLEMMLANLKSVARYAKMTHDQGLATATQRTIAEILYPRNETDIMPTAEDLNG